MYVMIHVYGGELCEGHPITVSSSFKDHKLHVIVKHLYLYNIG